MDELTRVARERVAEYKKLKHVRRKDATNEQLDQARCDVCGEVLHKRGWVTIYPEWMKPVRHGRCL